MAIVQYENLPKEVTESTFNNAVYLDKNGMVVSKKDIAAVTKISRQEALRRGLRPLDDVPAFIEETLPETAEKAVQAAPENKALPRTTIRRKKG